MNTRSQLLCIRSGYVFLALFVVGWVPLAHFVPPPDPAAGAHQIADMFRGNTTGIRLGMCLCIFASALLLPWGGAVIWQMRQIEGGHSPLVYAWIVAQACLTIEFIYPCMFWAVAAFRPDDGAVAAEKIRAFNDLAWLPFLGITSTAAFQAFALAIVTLNDRRPAGDGRRAELAESGGAGRAQPMLPRWFGYFQIWDALLFAPAGLIMFFHDGPLAWNGVIAFWVAIIAAAAWFLVTTPVIAAAIKRHASRPDESEDLASRVRRLEERLSAITRM
jgi:hypothetical protein